MLALLGNKALVVIAGTLEESMQRFDEDVLVIGQIETSSGIDNVQEIAGVEGLDGR